MRDLNDQFNEIDLQELEYKAELLAKALTTPLAKDWYPSIIKTNI